MIDWLRKLFRREPKPCTCDGCTGRERRIRESPYISESLDLWVGRDGELHWRVRARFVGDWI